jgi:hypothetical protein
VLIGREVKYLVIEALTLVPPDHFRLAMTSVLSDPTVPFIIKLDQGMYISIDTRLRTEGPGSYFQVEGVRIYLP